MQGEALNVDDLTTVALASLNQMFDEWSLERLMVYGTYVDTLTMTPNVAAYSSSQLASGQRPAAKPLAINVRYPGCPRRRSTIRSRSSAKRSTRPVVEGHAGHSVALLGQSDRATWRSRFGRCRMPRSRPGFRCGGISGRRHHARHGIDAAAGVSGPHRRQSGRAACASISGRRSTRTHC